MKEDKPPKRKKLTPYEMFLQNVGVELQGVQYPGYTAEVYDPVITKSLEEQKWTLVRDIIGRFGEGLIGLEEEKRKKDFYQKPVEDEDGYVRIYNFVKDLETGKETKLSLAQDVDAVRIEDIESGTKPDPRKTYEAKKFLLGKMFEDTDPLSGKFYKGIGADVYAQSIMNSIPGAILTLENRLFGNTTYNRYPGAEEFVNKLDITEEGVTYDNIKLDLPPEITNTFYEWFNKKITHEDAGTLEVLSAGMVGEVMNLPFYLLAGGIVGKAAAKVAPAFMKSTSLLTKIPRAQALTFGTLLTASTPRTVVHTLDGGVDAFLEDIKHTAEFSLMAGVFHTAGEGLGLGVSKLFNRPKATDFNTLTDILRKNPQITASLTGGFSSAALGYATGGDNFEERVSNALMFAALHFATPSAWKEFSKAKDKNIMVETDDYDTLVMAMRSGKSLPEALKEAKITEPRYYIREGDTLTRIVGDRFVNFGIIEKVPGETLSYSSNAENFQYITQAMPFYRKLYKDALKDYRVKVIADKIESEGFKNIKNPYKEGTEQYYIYEFNKRNTAERLAAIHYSKELYKTIKQNELPDIPGLNEILKVSAEGLGMPERVYRRMMSDIFPEYIKNPEAFIGRLKSEGGSLSFLPKEYRQSFESSLNQTEKFVKRYLNGKMLQRLEAVKNRRIAQSFIKVTDELVKEFSEIKTLADYHRALEKIGYSNQVFEKIRERIKAKSLTPVELDEFIAKHSEEMKNAELDYQGGIGILRNNYRHWEALSSLIDTATIREIGRTGAISPELKELLDKYDLEISKDPDFFINEGEAPKLPDETLAFPAEKASEFPRPLVERFQPSIEGFTDIYIEPVPEGVSRNRGEAIIKINDKEVPVTLIDEALNEKGEPLFKHTKTYIVEFPDGKLKLVGEKALKSRTDGNFSDLYNIISKELTNDIDRFYANYQAEALLYHKENQTYISFLKLRRKPYQHFIKNFSGDAREFNEFLSKASTNPQEVNKVIRGNTYSLQEVLEATINAYKRVIADPKVPETYRKTLQFYLDYFSPFTEMISKLEGIRVVFIKGRTSTSDGSFYPPSFISRLSLRSFDAPIISLRNVNPAAFNMLEVLVHESIHALTDITSPISKFYRSNSPGYSRFMFARQLGDSHSYYHKTIQKIVEILAEHKNAMSESLSESWAKRVLMGALDYTFKKDTWGQIYPEIFTMIFSRPELAALAANIPYPGVKKGYNLVNAAVDTMRGIIFNKYIASNPNFKPTEAQYTVLDELASLMDRWLKINGIVDPSTNKFRRGVGYRNLLEYYAEGAARIEGLLDPFEQKLIETEPEYKEALAQLGVSEEQSMVGKNRIELIRQKLDELVPQTPVGRIQTPATGQTEATPISTTPGNIEPANVKTLRIGAPKSVSYPIEHRKLIETEKIQNFAPIPSAYKPIVPNEESKPSFEKDHKNKKSAEVREIPKENKITELEKVREERLSKEIENLQTNVFKAGKSEEPILPNTKKLTDFIIDKSPLVGKIPRNVKNYLYQTIVPVYRKDLSQRFREEVYRYGEEMIRYAPYYFNTIVKRVDGWFGGETWRRFAKPDRKTGEATSPDAIKFLQAFKDYEYGRYKGLIEKELTWEEFADWAKFNPEQRRMLNIYKGTLDDGIQIMKQLKTRYLTELEPHLSKYLSEKQGKELSEKYGVEGAEKLDEFLNNNLEIKKEIAQKIIDNNYADWGKTVYYNSVRPVTPKTIILEFSKPTGEVDKDNNPIMDRVRTYTESMAEAETILKDMIAKGWTKDEMYQVSRIIKYPDQWGKLRAEQLVKLAEEGHIPYNDKVIQALLEVTKKGVDIHSIRKDYVPGMRYTAKEFEGQLIDFLREAVYGSYKAYTLTKINENLNRWQGELNDLAKGLSDIKTKGIDNKTLDNLQAEFLYARGYYNQLKAPEKTIIDKIRGLAFSHLIGGIKPSFLFMQSVQSLQTGLHLAFKELGSFPEASRFLGEASTEAMNYAFMLHARKKGQKLTGYNYDKELLDFMDKAEKMNKLKAVGISEMVGIEAEPDYYYSGTFNRAVEGFIRVNNLLGAGVEKFTRLQTLALFWKVGKAKGLEGQALESFVLDNLDKSMTQFGKGGRAPLFESKSAIPNQGTLVNALKKSFLSLKTFSFYNYSLYHNLIREKAWGALVSKTLVGLGLHGIKRFPLMAGLFMIAGLFTDDDIDYEAMKLADALDEKLPVKLGSFLDRGLASALGTGLDFSNTFAEDSPLLTDMLASIYSPTWEGKLLELTLGAPFGYTKNTFLGLAEYSDYISDILTPNAFATESETKHREKRIRKVLPLWMQNVISAMEFNIDGVEVRNKKILAREDLTSWDIFLKALSFPVERINKAYAEAKFGIDVKIRREQQVITTAKQFIKEMRTSKKLPLQAKLNEIKKAEEAMKEAKKNLIKLEQEKRKESL